MLLWTLFLGQIIAYDPTAVLIENCFDMPVHDFCVMEQDEPRRVTWFIQDKDLGAFGELPSIMPNAVSKYSWIFSQLDFHIVTVANSDFRDLEAKALGGFNHDLHDARFDEDGMTFPSLMAPPVPFGFAVAPTEEQIVMPTNITGGDLSTCDEKCHHGVLGTMMTSAFTMAAGGASAGYKIGQLGGPTGAVSGLIIGGLIGAPIGIIAGYELGMGNFATPDITPKIPESDPELVPVPEDTEGSEPTADNGDPELVPIPKCTSSSQNCVMPNPDHEPRNVGSLPSINVPVLVKPVPTANKSLVLLIGRITSILRQLVNPKPLHQITVTPGPGTLPRPAPIGVP